MLEAFTAGLLLITVSELGDKTFFIAAILAMQYPRKLVFMGVSAALAAMTILSVLLGQAVAMLPKVYIYYGEVILFIAFGLKLLYEGIKMSSATCDTEVIESARQAVTKAEKQLKRNQNIWVIVLKAFVLTFMAEWGDRTQIATVTLSARSNPVGVTIGAILGHGICGAIAVIGGQMLAGKISERQLTIAGGCLFLVFGIVAAVQG